MKMLTPAATAAKIGLSEATLRGLRQRGQFVTPVQVAPRRIAFVESEVDDWLAGRPRGQLPCPAMGKSGTSGVSEATSSEA